MPTRGILPDRTVGSARAASGHAAAAAPARAVMNSRLFTRCLPVLSTERIPHLSYGRRLLHCGISIGPMSASGHWRTFGDVRPTSALPSKADIAGCYRHVRFVPIADGRVPRRRLTFARRETLG